MSAPMARRGDSFHDDDDEPTMISADAASPPREPPPIEVVLSRQAQVLAASEARATGQRYRMLEVWTRNRVYVVDSALECIEVIDRRTGRPEAAHSLLGASLAGDLGLLLGFRLGRALVELLAVPRGGPCGRGRHQPDGRRH